MKKLFTFIATALISANIFAINYLQTIKNLYAQRNVPEKLDECIKVCESALAAEKNREVAVYLAKAYYFKGEGTTENSLKLELFDKGVKAGETAMQTIETYTKAMASGQKDAEPKAIAEIKKEEMDALYWTAANLARYAKYASFSKKLAVKGRVRYLWDRVAELDANFNYGGANRFFGGYYALVPSITGEQDPVKSKEYLDKAVAAAPYYLETKVLYAEAYCTHSKVKDKALFQKLLNEVINDNVSQYPEILPENENAKIKAKALLEKEKELFE